MLIVFFPPRDCAQRICAAEKKWQYRILYENILNRLCKIIVRVRFALWKNPFFLLLHDITQQHSSTQRGVCHLTFGTEKWVPVLGHDSPPTSLAFYSSDLNPSDFFLLPKLKMEVEGTRFTTNFDSIQKPVTEKLE